MFLNVQVRRRSDFISSTRKTQQTPAATADVHNLALTLAKYIRLTKARSILLSYKKLLAHNHASPQHTPTSPHSFYGSHTAHMTSPTPAALMLFIPRGSTNRVASVYYRASLPTNRLIPPVPLLLACFVLIP